MMKAWIFVGILATCYAKVIQFQDCGSVGGKISSLDVTPCDDSKVSEGLPCILHHGTNYSVAVNFTSLEDSKTVSTKIYGIIAGAKVPFKTVDSCASKSLNCPMAKSTSIQYKDNLLCEPEYPRIKLGIFWDVVDDNGKSIFCFLIRSEITD